ncbi:MAG: hypothetical protein ABW051_10770 [Burkholderiaceae bacterium]
MKLKAPLLALAAAFAVATPVFASDDHSAKHGGIFVETKALDFEIVAKPDVLQVYVSDHGKPVKLDGAKAKVTLLNGAEKSEAELAPTGGKFEAKGAFKVVKGTKGIAAVTLAGKPAATARFEVK